MALTLVLSACATTKTITPLESATPLCSPYGPAPYWEGKFGTWDLKVCETADTHAVIVEVWDRHLLYAGSEKEWQNMSNREAEKVLSDPKYKTSTFRLEGIRPSIVILGWHPNHCHDQLGHQKMLIVEARSEPRWGKVKFATFGLLNPEIVLAQLEVDSKTGKFSAVRGTGNFVCWFEPPAE